MRKRFKNKKRSCALCKPHKMGWVSRWKAKEFTEIQELEKIKKSIIKI
ncbi:MAG: hypothetical protein Q8N87_02930 [bacterium]|nr:hypothetical protein [bacterium]